MENTVVGVFHEERTQFRFRMHTFVYLVWGPYPLVLRAYSLFDNQGLHLEMFENSWLQCQRQPRLASCKTSIPTILSRLSVCFQPVWLSYWDLMWIWIFHRSETGVRWMKISTHSCLLLPHPSCPPVVGYLENGKRSQGEEPSALQTLYQW